MPVNSPKTELCARDARVEPFEATAVPPAWNEPLATSLPVLLPRTPPLLIVKLLTPFGVSIATDMSRERAATVPLPGPLTDPATLELAVAVSEPLVAVAVPWAPNEAVPPVLLARPLEKEPAIATFPRLTAKE